MWLFAGLGNPGDKHTSNRHNIGFMVIDVLAEEYGASSFKSKFQGQLSDCRIGGEKVALLKPQTFMNNSGQSIAAAAKFFKIPTDRIVVFYDELDIAPGKIKLRQGGGAAGHNGIRSMMSHLDNPDFWRVRIGIGHPGEKSRVSGYVLSDFAKADQKWLERLMPALAEHTPLLIEHKDSEYMTRVAEACKD